MKKLVFTTLVILISILSMKTFAQDIIDITPGTDLKNLVPTIEGDTTATGERANPNRIYRLERDAVYLMSSTLKANYPVHLIATDGEGRPPMLVRAKDATGANINPMFKLIGSNTTYSFKDIIFQGVDLDRAYDAEWTQATIVEADTVSISFDGCVFNGFEGGTNTFYGSSNLRVYFRDCVWRNGVSKVHPFIGQQVQLPALVIDTLVVTNCTYFNNNSFWLFQENHTTKYAVIEHNTIFTSIIDEFRMRWLVKANVRSNLWYGPLAYGDTEKSRVSSWFQPDNSPASVISLFEVPQNILDEVGMSEADRIVNVSNNAYFWPQQIKDYWASYDYVFPPLWMNERTQGMFDDDATWPGFSDENNVEADPKFTDTEMDTWISDEVAKFCTEHRNTSADTTWGTATGNRNYDDHKGVDILTGIAWPLPESMAYTNATLLTAGHDGLPVGDLNWDPAKRAQYVEPGDITDVRRDNTNLTPTDYVLSQNYPNPFNPSTIINFSIPEKGLTSLKVFNVLGQEVVTLVNQELAQGTYKYDFDGAGLTSGIYFYELKTNNFSETKKMMLVK